MVYVLECRYVYMWEVMYWDIQEYPSIDDLVREMKIMRERN